MKKILMSFLATGLLSSGLQADFLRTEIGVGSLTQKPTGYISGTTQGKTGSITYTDNSTETEVSNIYAWAYFKHPLPLIPNLRIDYNSIENTGLASLSGELGGISTGNLGSVPTNLNIKQLDITPYYNILDNTFWTTIDLGINARIIETSYDIDSEKIIDDEIAGLPLLYTRARIEIPFSNFGFEGIVKWISDGDNEISDIYVKADYTFDITPLIQPGIEVGYRETKFKANIDDGDSNTDIDLSFKGIYFGGMLRF